MDILERLHLSAIIPVVVLEKAADAVPAANALLAGSVDVMEITMRTADAADCIAAVARECPGMLVGAGTVVTLAQCKQAVACGAKFIVSPGLCAEVVAWCVDNGVTIIPGCATPTEIMAAMAYGLGVVKFFPAGVYGGLPAMKALSGPFGGIRFIPTGGVNGRNIGEYMAAPFVHAVGGSWVCTQKDIAQGQFDAITAACLQARAAALGYELAHIGINCADAQEAQAVCGQFSAAFGFGQKSGNSSNFITSAIEVMKAQSAGAHGHIAIQTNAIGVAVADLARHGFHADMETAKFHDGRMAAVYLHDAFGGFSIHLLQKQGGGL